MSIDGRALANEIFARIKARAAALPRPPRVLAIVVNETAITRSYLAIKKKRAADAGCVLDERTFPEHVSAEALCSCVAESGADAVIVQLPLPARFDARSVCDAIPLAEDADVLSRAARGKFEKGQSDALLPPVVGAVKEIFNAYHVATEGKRATVIGAGFLVGAPVAAWLMQQNANVEVATLESGNLSAALRAADIVVSGAGAPHLIKPEMLKEGVVLIDAGTSESNGQIVGDADPACAGKCALFTPVPGGVGPVAVAKLFENVVTLAERNNPIAL